MSDGFSIDERAMEIDSLTQSLNEAITLAHRAGCRVSVRITRGTPHTVSVAVSTPEELSATPPSRDE